ncbi:TonB-dependent receptor [Crocinitomix algicola]|uniref:TonB-dependent receptor n=1 Tax=Crocinitomix algicola TaxID=1740263 RepID=UPI000872C6F1|nr:TonB-dependent receptor [Crocinitomix algicola]
MKNKILQSTIAAFSFLIGASSFAQGDKYEIISQANRPISPSYKIADKPAIIDTVIPIPDISYPLLSRNMHTEISLDEIEASKIRIVKKLDKLYPGYVKLGIGNYASPLGEFYYNSVRNRRSSMGVHVKHNSSFGNIKDYAPSGFDQSKAHLFGEFFTTRHKFESDINYLNHGYHYYGILDTLDLISNDSLKNRVQSIGGNFKFSNYERKDSAKLLYTVKTGYDYFHEFDPKDENRNAKNTSFNIGTELEYKLKQNVYNAAFNIKYNKYKFGDENPNLPVGFWHNDNNTIVQLKPVISSYGDKWKVVYGADINFDFGSDEVFKIIPVVEGKYSLFNNMFIPYAGIGGGVQQNTFKSLNRINEFIASEQNLKNTKEFKFYAGIKGTLSKKLSFNIAVHSTNFSDMALFVNDTIWSNLYEFNIVYDRVNALGIDGSISYQAAEKLKIDAIVAYNRYTATDELYAWNMPALDMKLRGAYNLFDKIYVKADLTLLGGRKSPEGLFTTNDDDEDFDLGFVADANLSAEYRYNNRISGFIQFNNLAAQKYYRWNRYRVQGFQVLGGVTFAF